MKALKSLLILTVLSTVSCEGWAQMGTALPGEINDFKLATCRRDGRTCYKVQAPKAEGSSLKRLFAFSDALVTIEDGKTGRKTTQVWSQGYYDLEMNRLVVWKKVGGLRVEKAFDL